MGWREWLGLGGAEDQPVSPKSGARFRTISLETLQNSNLEPVEVTPDAILVVEPPPQFYAPVQASEVVQAGELIMMGPEMGTSRSAFNQSLREEYNPALRGHWGIRKFDEMRRSDSVVRSALLAVKAPITGATWFIKPAEETELARQQAEFVHMNLYHWMTYSWSTVLHEALLMMDYGHYIFEKVWAIEEHGGERRVVVKKLAPRHPLDIVEDGWNYDRHGGPVSVTMHGGEDQSGNVTIPIQKLLVFTHEREGGDLRGRSVLRSAYKNWFYAENAYKIDGIQKERHGIGIPVIKLPAGFTPKDKTYAHELGRNLRTNEAAHVVLPPNWDVMFAKLEGQPVSALETASHHARMIYQNVLASAVFADAEGDAEAMMDLFYKSLRWLANDIADVVNQYLIPELIGFNWPDTDSCHAPQFGVRKLGDTAEARTISFALRNLVGAGVIVPDDRLDAWSREIIDAPPAEPGTARVISTPQLPGGQPRQSQAANQRNQPGAEAGRDGGGTGGGGVSGN